MNCTVCISLLRKSFVERGTARGAFFVFALYLSVVFAYFFEHKLPFSSPSHASLTVGVRESDSVCVCVWFYFFCQGLTREIATEDA